MVTSLCDAVGPPKDLTIMDLSIHVHNAGILILAETLPPLKKGIKLVKTKTIEQLSDMFTKTLPRVTFEYLRSKLIDW